MKTRIPDVRAGRAAWRRVSLAEQEHGPSEQLPHCTVCFSLSRHPLPGVRELSCPSISELQVSSTLPGPCSKYNNTRRQNKGKDTLREKKTHLKPHKHPENCSKIKCTKFKFSLNFWKKWMTNYIFQAPGKQYRVIVSTLHSTSHSINACELSSILPSSPKYKRFGNMTI